ncbi:MAG: hypothetical protein ABIY51_01625 [Ferruginibacter sp.]
MKEEAETAPHSPVYFRIVALWVVCEAFAGGIMHAFQVPFSGMIVSALSVTCIILLAWHVPGRLAISKACFIVILFKLALSPHSPPTAYVAVFFQGMMGQLLFNNKKQFRLRAIVLGFLSLVESAVQRLLILWLVYGNSFWQAVDDFLKKLFKQQSATSYISWIAWGYIFIHAIVGIAVGIIAATIAKKSIEWKQYANLTNNMETKIPSLDRKSSPLLKPVGIVTWLILLMLFIQSLLFPSNSILSGNKLLHILLRALLIILGWIFIVSPLLLKLLQKLLSRKKKKLDDQFIQVQKLIPGIKNIFLQSIVASKNATGLKRIKLFIKILLGNILNP